MKPVPLALCITELFVGGAERCLAELAARIDTERFTPRVYSLKPLPQLGEPSVVPSLEKAGVAVRSLEMRGPISALVGLVRFRRLLADQRAEILQSFLFHANLAGRLAARAARVRRVVAGIRVAERAAGWHLRLDRLTAGSVDHFVCVSTDVARFSSQIAGLPAKCISVIPNGIDPERFPAPPLERAALGVPPGRGIVSFIGRLDYQKGLDWLLATAPRWLDAGRAYLVLVGAGPQEEPLREQAVQLGIGDRVRFLGWRPDAARILAASDLCVLPSRWEGMPNVALEAMASRRPLVATEVEGVCQLLGPDSASQTVPFGDSQVLIDKILAILSSPALASRLGAANRRRAEREFSLTAMVSQYQDLWKRLLDR